MENTLPLTIARTLQDQRAARVRRRTTRSSAGSTGDGRWTARSCRPRRTRCCSPRCRPAALPELAELLADRPLPGVNGLTADAEAFAAGWRALTGADTEVAMRTRLFRLAS